jgi:hypothetical protein
MNANGRIGISMTETENPDFSMFYEGTGIDHYARDAERGMKRENDSVSELFFSPENVEALQQGVRYLVWKKSENKHIIAPQSERELYIVMRSTYVEFARHLPYDIVGQVRDLNKRVLDFVVPRIIIELRNYEGYRRDISTLPTPLEHPKNMSSKGSKFLFQKEF